MSNSIFDTLSAAEKRTRKIMVTISIMISDERKRRRMTQKQFAEFMGVKQSLVSRWENGHYNFTIEKVVEIFEKLDLKLNFELPKSKKTYAMKFNQQIVRQISQNNINTITFDNNAA